MQILSLCSHKNDYGVYATGADGFVKGPFDTPLLFRGTESECEDFIIGDREVVCACGAGCTDGVCTAQELGEPIPADIAALYSELDAANARRERGSESPAEQRERWDIEDALTRRQA